MPKKYRPEDWDRYFAPNARRRGGPLTALVNLVLLSLIFLLLGAGAVYGRRYLAERSELREQQLAALNATQTQLAATTFVQYTATARARNATATADALPPPISGRVVQGGNLRSEPRVADETRLGLLNTGDEVIFLEQTDVEGVRWYRIRVAGKAAPDGVAVGTEGWMAGSLLTQPSQPLPTPGPGGAGAMYQD